MTVAAIRVKDPTKVKQVVLRQPGFFGRGKASGVRVYENKNDSRYVAVDGDVLVGATDRDMLEQALAMHRSDNRMREASFERDLVGLPDGAYVRVSGDPRTMIGADARMRPALTVKWLSSMRRLGATLKLHDDGVALDFRIPTDAKSLTDADLPLSPSPGTIPLIGAKGEVQAGVRDPGRLARFALAVERAIAPRRVARAERIEPSGVDLQQQLPRHLGDVGVVAIDPVTRAFAARARIQQPHDVETGLQALAPALPDIAAALGVPGVGLATPPAGERFYALARPNAKTVVFGVIGDSLVVASEARRAAGLASESTHSAPVPKASAAVTVDARELVGKVLADQLGGPAALAAPFLVSGLRDLSGWLTISRAALRGHFKLTIVK